MSKEQYDLAYGAIRYICHDYDNYDYAPKNYKHREARLELASLPWQVVGAAYVSWKINDDLVDPLRHDLKYWGLHQRKLAERKDADNKRRAKNLVTVSKDEYRRLLKKAGEA